MLLPVLDPEDLADIEAEAEWASRRELEDAEGDRERDEANGEEGDEGEEVGETGRV